MYLQINRMHEFRGTLSAAEWVFFFAQFGPDFHVTSDPQICRFRVPLIAAEWVFILVLIFINLQISRIRQSRGTLSVAEWFLTGPDFHVSSDQQEP